MYKPLPDCLTIKESEIHGLGLFATEDIPANTDLGASHYSIDNEIFDRTPLGGFYNHSDNPNVERLPRYDIYPFDTERACIVCYHLLTIRDIKAGEELTAYYGLYNPENNDTES